MKVVIDIPDNELNFGMKVLKSLSFVKKVKLMSANNVSFWNNLEQASNEVTLHKKGVLKLKTAQELLNELK